MKEQKTADFIKERYPFYDEDLATRDVELNGEQVQELMQSFSDQQNAELMSEIERWKALYELGKKSIRELIKANEKLESVESENAELREQLASEIESREHWQRQTQRYQKYHRELNAAMERAKELEGLLAIWVKQNNYLRRHSISDFDGIHGQTKKALKK